VNLLGNCMKNAKIKRKSSEFSNPFIRFHEQTIPHFLSDVQEEKPILDNCMTASECKSRIK
jgi:hypothetical protein